MLANGEFRAVMSRWDFRRLLWTRFTSQLGDGLFQGGIGGSILFNPQQNTSPLKIAMGFAILLLPYSLIGPYVGVFLDRWSRRSILVYANLSRAALVLPVTLCVWLGTTGVWFALLALLVIAANRFFLAGLSASLPHVTDERRLATGNAIAATVGTVCYSAGLALAVGLQHLLGASNHGYAVITLVAVAGYLGSSLIARYSFRSDALGPDELERRRDSIRAGLADAARGMVSGARHLAGRRPALYALLTQTAFRGLYGVLTITVLLLARNTFHSTSFLGGVVIAGGIGALLAAFVTPRATRQFGPVTWLAALVAAVGVALPLLGLTFEPWPLLGAVFILNVTSMGMKIVVDTTIQREIEDEYRGRVFSLNDSGYNLPYVAGLFVGAYVLPDSGRSAVTVASIALGYLLLAAGYALASRRAAGRVSVGADQPH